jgi:hypothetical protein
MPPQVPWWDLGVTPGEWIIRPGILINRFIRGLLEAEDKILHGGSI